MASQVCHLLSQKCDSYIFFSSVIISLFNYGGNDDVR